MGYPAKIQQITRKDFNQYYKYYINFLRSIAAIMNFSQADPVEWKIHTRQRHSNSKEKECGKCRTKKRPVKEPITISTWILW